jgi:Domain of unknown function (DUF222)
MELHAPRTEELDRLGDEIAELSAHLDAATARLLELIRMFDARGGWNTGFRSCAAWLSWRVGLDPGAARERVRVARALGSLPLLSEALARGELSYAKVRALTRVATPETEARLLAVGRAGTAAHVERIVRGWRRVDHAAEARVAARQHARRGLQVFEDEDGMVVVRGRLAPEVGALLRRALEAGREMLYQRARREAPTVAAEPTVEPPTLAQQQADAVALVAESALHHAASCRSTTRLASHARRRDVSAETRAPSSRASILARPASATRWSSTSMARCWRTRRRRDSRCWGAWWRSGRGRAPSRQRCGGRSSSGIGAAASRDARYEWPRGIISGTGLRAGRRRSPTSPCCVGTTTARCTSRVSASSGGPTAPYDSGARTVGSCPRYPRRPQCQRIQWEHSRRTTPSRDSPSTRGPDCRGGSASRWI